MQKKEK